MQKNGKRFTKFFSVNRFPNLHNPHLFSFSLAQTQPPFFSHIQPSPLSSLSHRNPTPVSALARTDQIPPLSLLAQIHDEALQSLARHEEASQGVARPSEARNTSTRFGFLFFRFTKSAMGLIVVGSGLWFCW